MSFLLDKISNITQDAVLWKAGRLWSMATNPDAQVTCAEKIVEMLMCISTELKRNSYIESIASSIIEQNKELLQKTRKLESQQQNVEKQLDRLRRKKKLSEEEQDELEEYELEEGAVKEQMIQNRNGILPVLKVQDLNKMVKDALDQAAKKKQRQADLAAEVKHGQTNEDVGLPKDFKGSIGDTLRFGIYEHKGKYYSKNNRGSYDEISNFKMEIVHHVQASKHEAFRLCTFENEWGHSKMLMLNTDDLVTIGSFKKILKRMGSFSFRGNDGDLGRVTEYLERNEKNSRFIKVLGHDPQGDFYAFANGLIDTSEEGKGTFVPVDEFGLIELREKHYLIPAMSKMIEDEDEFSTEKKFVWIDNRNVGFENWSALHRQAYLDNGIICQMWLLSALFRDIIHGINEIHATPILCFYGQPGSGKGMCANSIMSMFGKGQAPIGLGSHSTPKSFLRKFAQLRNSVVWLDEYKNNIKKDFIEALKNIYDGISYSRAKMSMDFQTEDIPVNSACLLSGQEMPTIEPALFSRVVLLQFQPGKDRPEEQVRAYEKLKKEEEYGISSVLAEILRHRPVIKKEFAKVFARKQREIIEQVDDREVPDRLIMCISILATVRQVLDPYLQFSFTQDEAEMLLVHNLRAQFTVSQGNDDLGKFWKVIAFLASEKRIVENEHFHVSDGYLYLRLGAVYPLYYQELYRNRGDANTMAESSLENYLKMDKNIFLDSQFKKRFPEGKNALWTWKFNYNALRTLYNLQISNSVLDLEEGEEEKI